MRLISATPALKISSGRRGFALHILRALVGTAFLFHGYGKVVDIPAFASEFQIPMIIASVAVCAQLVAGALLLVGLALATPLAAFTIAGTMSVATLQSIGRGEPFIYPHGHSYEASSFYPVASIALGLSDPAHIRFDATLQRNYEIGAGSQKGVQKEIRPISSAIIKSGPLQANLDFYAGVLGCVWSSPSAAFKERSCRKQKSLVKWVTSEPPLSREKRPFEVRARRGD